MNSQYPVWAWGVGRDWDDVIGTKETPIELFLDAVRSLRASEYLVLAPAVIQNQSSYISGWMGKLKTDKLLVIASPGAAQRAADWILGRMTDTQAEAAPPEVACPSKHMSRSAQSRGVRRRTLTVECEWWAHTSTKSRR